MEKQPEITTCDLLADQLIPACRAGAPRMGEIKVNPLTSLQAKKRSEEKKGTLSFWARSKCNYNSVEP